MWHTLEIGEVVKNLNTDLNSGLNNEQIENIRKVHGENVLSEKRKEKPWAKFDAIMAFAEWGLTRDDIGKDIDDEVFGLIESTGFKMLCGEPYLLRNLVKLGYYQEEVVKNEIDYVLGKIKEDGGFGCISTNKKINDPKKPHKSCARLTVEYLLLVAELHLQWQLI